MVYELFCTLFLYILAINKVWEEYKHYLWTCVLNIHWLFEHFNMKSQVFKNWSLFYYTVSTNIFWNYMKVLGPTRI